MAFWGWGTRVLKRCFGSPFLWVFGWLVYGLFGSYTTHGKLIIMVLGRGGAVKVGGVTLYRGIGGVGRRSRIEQTRKINQ